MVSFEEAVGVLLDEQRLEVPDERFTYDEARINVLGAVDGVVIHVTYTMGGEVRRIISARPASKKERRRYGYGS